MFILNLLIKNIIEPICLILFFYYIIISIIFYNLVSCIIGLEFLDILSKISMQLNLDCAANLFLIVVSNKFIANCKFWVFVNQRYIKFFLGIITKFFVKCVFFLIIIPLIIYLKLERKEKFWN